MWADFLERGTGKTLSNAQRQIAPRRRLTGWQRIGNLMISQGYWLRSDLAQKLELAAQVLSPRARTRLPGSEAGGCCSC